MKDIFIFPAVFSKDEDGYSIYFPGIEGAFTCAETFEEAVFMAKDCLELNLDGIEEIPKLINIEDIKLENNEYVVMIEADMVSYRKKYYSQPVKKTLTIPKWLNDLGVQKKVNFSKLLQESLKKELDLL
ncbi:type II toxin-antitoxin system HicB family antitoxin [Candidatus Cetobacterium colombiensis]|uniref:Type II toxin-antitoxin system HicB family antitoxin n=1 Tax=Candidatus Cetobacterium colombiensis TaxID=3073100 RepID=A0ABU4WCV5_9FUSO|nr:type II toxin-antitoxin system HicB family antitoxin [Candidatus Cetobacterium colombiensis]MDX8337362.1 type II toxin-antitoxin system HicB family antitoxin [Candidatus Cetobacterium colombiensis]